MPLSPPVADNWNAGELTSATKFNANLRDAFGYFAQPPVFRARDNAGTQSIPNAANTTMVLGNVIEDTYTGWTTGASNRYVAQVSGIYLVIVTVVMTGGTGAGNMQFAMVNFNQGAQFTAGWEYPIASTTPEGVQAALPVFMRVGDSVTPSVFQNSGAALTLSSTSVGVASAMEIIWLSR